MKNKGMNLFTMTNVFKQIVSYQRLAILAPFEGVCFGHTLSKAYQYATFDEKVNKFTMCEHQICIIFNSSL